MLLASLLLKSSTSGLIKEEYNVQLIPRKQLQEVQNGLQYDKGVLTVGLYMMI